MPTSTDVKWIRNDFRAAPILAGNAPGGLIAALDALLVTGWGSVTAVSASVTSGIATITFNAGSSFAEHAVVLVAGATPSELNGERRVLTANNTQITFATTAPDGTASGSITVKYAPAGWEKVFTGTNKAVYRSADILGNRHYLRVDDSSGLYSRVRGYESMSDIDTGTGSFPLDSHISGGGYWHKSTTANTTAIPYLFAADSRAVVLALCHGVGTNSTQLATKVQGFGDGIALNPAGDAWCSFLSCHGSGATVYDYGALSGSTSDSNANGLVAHPRGWQGIGSAVLARPIPEAGRDTQLSGACDIFGAGPSLIDGQIKVARMLLKDQAAGAPVRCAVPGVYYIPQSGVLASFPVPFALSEAPEGRKLAAVIVGTSVGAPTGVALVDVTGPWRV